MCILHTSTEVTTLIYSYMYTSVYIAITHAPMPYIDDNIVYIYKLVAN